MSQNTYVAPTLTELGTLEELTEFTAKLKLNFKSIDIQFNKTGLHVVRARLASTSRSSLLAPRSREAP